MGLSWQLTAEIVKINEKSLGSQYPHQDSN